MIKKDSVPQVFIHPQERVKVSPSARTSRINVIRRVIKGFCVTKPREEELFILIARFKEQ